MPRRDREAYWRSLKDADPRFLGFMTDISAEDERGAVLRAATYVEYYLERVIARELLFPDEILWPALTFQRRLELALAFGDLPHAMKGPLRGLARIRNRIAHDPTADVSDEEVRRIVDSFDAARREQFDGYARIAAVAPDEMTKLIACLMVIEQNLRWVADKPNATLMIRREARKITELGVHRYLEEDDE
jgi:hypothetical protein